MKLIITTLVTLLSIISLVLSSNVIELSNKDFYDIVGKDQGVLVEL